MKSEVFSVIKFQTVSACLMQEHSSFGKDKNMHSIQFQMLWH